MFTQRQSIALSFVYLILSGPHVALAIRSNVNATASASTDLDLVLATETEQDAQWCNPMSRMRTKYYKFEVHEESQDGSVGSSTAYELVRDKKDPVLKVHHGQSWAVKFAEDDEAGSDGMIWSLAKARARSFSNEEFHIYEEAEHITFGEANPDKELREYVEFKWKNGKTTRVTGGLFYQGGLIRRGIEKIEGGEAKDEGGDASHYLEVGRDGVRKDNIVKHDAKKGAKYTAGGLTTVAGGFFVAAMVQGIQLSNTAIIGAALATTLGGAAVGAAIGAGIGAVVGLAGIIGLIKLLRDKGLSGAEKIWDKLYCMDFEICYTRATKNGQSVSLMVIDGSQCPEKPADDEE